MAGIKETPRQKLIGLMYLVLLAMLALQVSSAIIEKFQYMNTSLEMGIKQSLQRNQELLSQIRYSVEKNKSAEKDLLYQRKAEQLRAKTTALINHLDALKLQLVDETGGMDEDGNFAGAKEEETVARRMCGHSDKKDGLAYALQPMLNEYTSYINDLCDSLKIEKSFAPLAMDGKEDPIFRNKPEQKNKDFAQLNFEHTPLVAALAVLSEKQTRILAMESECLTVIGSKIGMLNIPVDKLRPVVQASSNYVVAGTDYNANVFMAAYSSTFKPEIAFENKPLEVNNEGVGTLSFKAAGGNYDAKGLAKKIWKGTIRFPKSDGTDSLYTIEQEYFVVQPTIQVQAATIPHLYRNSGNKLTIQVPALGADYRPEFRADGATIEMGNRTGEIKVLPTQPNVAIKVYNNGVFIGKEKFRVKNIPTPAIELYCGGRNVNPMGVSSSTLRNVEVKVIPDNEFCSLNPEDCRYKTASWEATHVRNGRGINNYSSSSGQASLTSFMNDARSGDIIIIDKVKVKRRNYRGEIEDVSVSQQPMIIPIK